MHNSLCLPLLFPFSSSLRLSADGKIGKSWKTGKKVNLNHASCHSTIPLAISSILRKWRGSLTKDNAHIGPCSKNEGDRRAVLQ